MRTKREHRASGYVLGHLRIMLSLVWLIGCGSVNDTYAFESDDLRSNEEQDANLMLSAKAPRAVRGDNTAASIHDYDCNGVLNGNAIQQTWYFDGDGSYADPYDTGDGFGDPNISKQVCLAPDSENLCVKDKTTGRLEGGVHGWYVCNNKDTEPSCVNEDVNQSGAIESNEWVMDECGICGGQGCMRNCAGESVSIDLFERCQDCVEQVKYNHANKFYAPQLSLESVLNTCNTVCAGLSYMDGCGSCDDDPTNDDVCVQALR